MRKTVQLFGFAVLVMAILLTFTACGDGGGSGGGRNPFVGKWTTSTVLGQETLTFTSDLKFSQTGGSLEIHGSYTYDGNTATITGNFAGQTSTTAVISSNGSLVFMNNVFTKS
jgi:hypothetical protein